MKQKILFLIFIAIFGIAAKAQTIVGSGDGWSFDSEGVLTITKDFSYTVNEYCPWYKYCKSIKSVEFSDNVTTICRYAFRECNLLTDFTIPEGITKIEYEAFHDCKGLQSITIPKSIKSIAVAFSGCSNLKDAYFCGNIDDWVAISFAQNCFFSIIERLYIDNEVVHDVVVSEGIEKIKPFVFYDYAGLTSVVLPSTLKEIGTSAFKNCTNLESIFISEGVEIIYEQAFEKCSSLKSVVIPSTLKTIGIHAFDHCTGLESVVYKPQEELEIQNTTLNTVNAIFSYCNIKYVFFYGNCNTSTKTASTGDGIEDVFGWLCTVEMFFVPEEYFEEYSNRYQVENITKYNIIDSGEDEKFVYILEKNNYEKLGSWLNEGIEVEGDDISFILTENFDLDAENVTWQALGTAEHPFKGIFEGNNFSIIGNRHANVTQPNSIFGYIGEGAEIRNVVFSDFIIDATSAGVTDGGKTYYGLVARENKGLIRNSIFEGRMEIDADAENADEAQACLVIDNEEGGELDHVVGYFEGLDGEVTGNKTSIIVIQNIGHGRTRGHSKKTASNGKKKSKGNSTVSAEEPDDINLNYRLFTDEEFAGAEPAYWLNFDGEGYTGTFNGEWTQGTKHPVLAKGEHGATVGVKYNVVNRDESVLGPSPVFFATSKSSLEVEYFEKPLSIEVNGTEINASQIGDMKAKFSLASVDTDKGNVNVVLKYEKQSTPTAVDGIDAAGSQKTIKTVENGRVVIIRDGKKYDLAGRVLSDKL